MSELEDYLRIKLAERFDAYLAANMCPHCDLCMGLLDDKTTTVCLLCGHHSTFQRPPP